MERSSDSGSDNMVFSDIGVSRKTVPVTSFYGTTSGRCQGRDEEARYREDIRMLSAVLRQERPTVRECPALSSADSIA